MLKLKFAPCNLITKQVCVCAGEEFVCVDEGQEVRLSLCEETAELVLHWTDLSEWAYMYECVCVTSGWLLRPEGDL